MFDFYRISNDNVPLSNVYFPCLSILRLACLDLDPDWIAGLLRQCPVLEEIMLWEIPDHVTQAMVDAPCLAAGSNYCRLRRFHLTIYLSGITADRPEHPLDLTRWITSAPRLEYVVLWNTYPTNHMLYCISQIPSLKKFGTNHRGFQDSLVTTQGLLAFATGLSSSSIMKKQAVSQLQELRLEAFKPLTDSVMKALAGIDRLKDLHICRCPFITDEGIKLFLDNKKPGSLEKLSLSYCRRVTNSGIDYAISILGASKVSFIHRWHPTNT
ncbi:hypothetical protein BDA99DRAFT_525714 [Phascolomyces articulosus]|uniref:F-box/LRR-repeat protein 15/At3g58940/PEG3-like LRR domain-containing protein n=1 Tax=Phascolomyces articulosus TaxID=60185 RepID=A0AAD5K009_9FUNG|nr:hypothetical protein BDA99DRAFT_525714 [Phascolomyces articulosus]